MIRNCSRGFRSWEGNFGNLEWKIVVGNGTNGRGRIRKAHFVAIFSQGKEGRYIMFPRKNNIILRDVCIVIC